MAQFNYVGVDRTGKQVKGQIDVGSEVEVRMALRSQGVRPKSISKVGEKAGKVGGDLFSLFGKKRDIKYIHVPTKVIVVFTRQLQLLISSGIPLVQALEVLADQTTHLGLRDVANSIREKVSNGQYLWESMNSFPNVFPNLFISLIRAGETSGSIDLMLRRLSKYLEDEDRIRRMIKSAMMYPIMVMLVGLGVLILMLVFVIPKFEAMLKSANQELPAPTLIVISMSHFVQSHFLYIVGGGALGYYLFSRYIKTSEGRQIKDQVVFRTPIFGMLAQKSGIARFSRTLQTLLSAGVNLIDAIDICRTSADNAVIENAVSKIRVEVESGKTLGMILSKIDIFPKMTAQMVMVGESTGSLDKSLEKIADFYEADVEAIANNMTKLLEPFIIVVLGGMIGGLMVAMYLPIFKMAGAMG